MKPLSTDIGEWTREEFINYLEGTLIPDLEESGSEGHAHDYKLVVRFLRDEDREKELPLGNGTYDEAHCPACSAWLGCRPLPDDPNIMNCANCKTRFRRPKHRVN